MSQLSTQGNDAIYKRPAELLQELIRFNTTNPPGNEAECLTYINTLLSEAGFHTTILAGDPARPNLVARLEGAGTAPPLLLQGHIDVVTTERQVWRQQPFAANLVDDYIWGRGTLDMKGGVAMMLAALLRAKAEGTIFPGDVVLAVLSDEETGGSQGAQYLVEHHADLFKGIRYALGELGGFCLHIEGKRFYPIQVLEKQICWSKATLRGPGGHASLPMHGGATAKLGQLLQRLDQQRLPVHIQPVPQQMIIAMADALPGTIGTLLHELLDPAHTDEVLDRLNTLNVPGSLRLLLDPALHNNINVTIINGGHKVNVIPGEFVIEMDGRLLSGFTPEQFFNEIRQATGTDAEFEVILHSGGRAEADMGFYDTLASIIREADPGSVPVPFLAPFTTDGRLFSRLGIQTYGFLPMRLPEGFDFLPRLHAADERVPVEAIDFGTHAIYEALLRNKA